MVQKLFLKLHGFFERIISLKPKQKNALLKAFFCFRLQNYEIVISASLILMQLAVKHGAEPLLLMKSGERGMPAEQF